MARGCLGAARPSFHVLCLPTLPHHGSPSRRLLAHEMGGPKSLFPSDDQTAQRQRLTNRIHCMRGACRVTDGWGPQSTPSPAPLTPLRQSLGLAASWRTVGWWAFAVPMRFGRGDNSCWPLAYSCRRRLCCKFLSDRFRVLARCGLVMYDHHLQTPTRMCDAADAHNALSFAFSASTPDRHLRLCRWLGTTCPSVR